MTGTAEPIREPKTDAEWARSTQRRIESAENSTSLRAGEWVMSTSADGHLIASHVDGGSVILARKPTTGENNPDEIADSTFPSVTVTRTANQSVSGSGERIMFDGVEHEIGDWTGGATLFDAVSVPETGAYEISATVWFSLGGANLHGGIVVDGSLRMAGKVYDADGASWLSVTIAGSLFLDAGTPIALFALAQGVTRNVGAATVYTPNIPTSLSLSMTSRVG